MRKIVLLGLIVVACFACVHIQNVKAAEPIFFADFDAEGIPDAGVNDSANWKPENPSTIWTVGGFPANGTQCLQMAGSGCGSSGFTPLPTVQNWSNGIIQIDFGWADDDSWGIMFRRKAENNGYFVFLGFIETLDLALFDLGKLGLRNGQCLSEAPGIEEGPEPGRTIVEGKAIKAVRHNLAPLDQTANTSYTARILARGPKIRIWYGLTKNFPDDPLQEPDPDNMASMIEAEDATYTSGSVGIWHESNDNGRVDNVYVFDQRALAVGHQGRLAITWAGLKAQ